jgi:cell division protein ZapA
MKQIEVSIMGQSYLLGCPEGGEARLKEAVSHVDREMCAIRDSGKLKARERIAVLSALNLAYELTERPSVAAAPVAPVADAADVPSPEHVDRLIARIDQVLGQDGHLI